MPTDHQYRRGVGLLGALQGAGVAEIAVSDAGTGQKCDLQHPVENDRDLAEEKRTVEIWRQENVVERQQRHGQHGRGAHDVVEVGQRGKTPLRLVEAGKDVNETGIDKKTGQQDDQQAPTLLEAGFLEPNKKARDHCRRRGEQIVHENEPHPRREGRKASHRPDIAAQRGIKGHQYRRLSTRATLRAPEPRGLAPINSRILNLKVKCGSRAARRADELTRVPDRK